MTRVSGTLLIVGEGPLRGKLEQLTRELGVAQRVKFLGGVADVIPYYHAAELFTLASIARSEAFGIVQIEAMAAGLPVVNTKLDSGVPFVSLHGQTGFTVPPRDPVALGDAIGRLLNDSELRRAFGYAARIRAQQEFSLDTMVRRTMSLYEGVAAGTALSANASARNRI
jgi:rhamnosyl/mannosyltransferase